MAINAGTHNRKETLWGYCWRSKLARGGCQRGREWHRMSLCCEWPEPSESQPHPVPLPFTLACRGITRDSPQPWSPASVIPSSRS
jgi:hypothetical protein